MRERLVAIIVVVVLGAAAWLLPGLRRSLIHDVTWWDATPGESPPLPSGSGAGLPPTPRTRVVLVDGLTADVAATLPAWSAVCKRGIAMRVDVGFPTVSLPVQVALWTGLTQQQTGVVARSGRHHHSSYGHPLDPPLDQRPGRRGIPAQVAGSIAIAEDHGWIVRSLGFARAEPVRGDATDPVPDAAPEPWKQQWEAAALAAVATDAKLVLVHILRVDTAGHRAGLGADYREAAAQADAILGRLVEADRDARWFVVSDHGHLPTGGHGGEERDIRQVQGCIAGPGVVAGTAQLVHVVDVARALADSTGATLDPASRGRPITAALAAPLSPDQAVPPVELSRGVIAIFVVAAALALSAWGVKRWWLAPWWFVAGCALVYLVHGEPTLSMALTYRADGRLLLTAYGGALVLAVAATWIGQARTTLARVVVAQLAVPVAATAAAMTASGAWSAVLGADTAPVVPRYTAWMLALLLMVAHGAAAVALAVLARLVHRAIGRRARAAPPHSEPAAAE